jgi:hypothetical protein
MEMSRSTPDAQHRMAAAERRERAREHLAALSPGGSQHRAIDVTSAAVIEVRAAAMACPQCGGRYRILEHTRPVPGIRRVDVACRHCSTPRALWFRIVEREPN